jgi:hypothetical protein
VQVGNFHNLLLLGNGAMPGFIGLDFLTWPRNSAKATKSKLLKVHSHLMSLSEQERTAFCYEHTGADKKVQFTNVYNARG